MSRHEYRTPEGRTWIIQDGLVYGAEAEVAVWINARLGGGSVQQLFVAIGILKDGTPPESVTTETLPNLLAAGAYYFNHQSDDDVSDICVSVAADDAATGRPDVIRSILSYPFKQLGVRRISAEIDLSNDRAVRQAQKLGFKLEGRKRRMAAGGGDVGIFGLLPDECPLWGNGQ